MQLVLHEAAAAAPAESAGADSSAGAAGNASSAGQPQTNAPDIGGAVDAGDDGTGHELLESETAVAAAKRWYDEKGPFTGRFVLALPVLGAFRNSPTEYSLRYKVHPDTGDVVRAAL